MFFPVVFLYGVSRYLFIALALGVVLALAASYLVAMTLVPLFCARFIKTAHGQGGHHPPSMFGRFVAGFNRRYDQFLMRYDRAVDKALARPGATILIIMASFVMSLALYPCWVLPSSRERIRSVRHQRQSSYRLPPGDDQSICRARGKRYS